MTEFEWRRSTAPSAMLGAIPSPSARKLPFFAAAMFATLTRFSASPAITRAVELAEVIADGIIPIEHTHPEVDSALTDIRQLGGPTWESVGFTTRVLLLSPAAQLWELERHVAN